jgi:hypothetical protein
LVRRQWHPIDQSRAMTASISTFAPLGKAFTS